MEDLFKLIIFLALFLGPVIVKALSKDRDSDESERDLEARLDEAIRQAKDQVKGHGGSRSSPPPVASLPPRIQTSAPRPVTPMRVQTPPPIPSTSAQENRFPLPLPPLPDPLEALAQASEEEIVAAAKRKALQIKQTAEASLGQKMPKLADNKFDKLMMNNAYEVPIVQKKSEIRREQKAVATKPAVKSGLKRMIIHSEILQPPVSRRQPRISAGVLTR